MRGHFTTPYDPATGSTKDRIAWRLATICSPGDAEWNWESYRDVAISIAQSEDLMTDLQRLNTELCPQDRSPLVPLMDVVLELSKQSIITSGSPLATPFEADRCRQTAITNIEAVQKALKL